MNSVPHNILNQLNQYIISQDAAKKTIATAIRNRYRRLQIKDEEMKLDILPKNIMLIGSTGVGKTEIVRRASKIINAPFIKTEVTKFTEVGYVGKDVESIIRDLVEKTVTEYKKDAIEKKRKVAKSGAKKIVFEALCKKLHIKTEDFDALDKIKKQFESGDFKDEVVEIEVNEEYQNNSNRIPFLEDVDFVPGASHGIQMGIVSVSDVLKGMEDKPKLSKKTVKEALAILENQIAQEKADIKKATSDAIQAVEENGIVFLDEIDKIISNKENSGRGEVSREGVQRDLLPIIEGAIVSTKYGQIDTRHILFVSCGAFHNAKPSDLFPEFQGRFPIKVHLKNLNKEDFIKILSETHNNLVMQYTELMKVDDVVVIFTKDGIEEIAEVSYNLNMQDENLGARRLHTTLETVFEDIMFDYPKKEKSAKKVAVKINIDRKYVQKMMKKITDDKLNYAKFIL